MPKKVDKMNYKKLLAISVGFAFVASILFTSTPQNASALQGIPEEQALVYSGGESTNLREYDPATTHGSGDKLAFSGLVSLDPRLNVTPDIAETWEVSEDGTVYTFHIRENAHFHDGRAVTAEDFVYSWERAVSPELGSDTAGTYLGDILGVDEMMTGQADHISGLEVIDAHTLQVTIDEPKPYFIMKLTYPTAFVLDQANVESGEDWVHRPNGTGPYQLIEWKSGEYILYGANLEFYLNAPSIPYVIIKLFAGDSVRLYETGEVDVAGVSIYNADRFLDPAEPLHDQLVSGVGLCTSYITFDTTQPPFDDINVRKAFSMAFDRELYIDVVLRGKALPAVGPYPPGLPGFSYDLKGLEYDPEEARTLLQQSKYGGPQGLPPIVYTDAGIGNYVNLDVAAMAEMWQQNLGVTITVENIEYDHFYDQIYSGNHGQLVSGGWCADYPDPENFADVLFHSGSNMNRGGYSNPQLDALLEKARVERDVTTRMGMYQEAQQIIVDDAPVLFTTHSLSYELVKPYLKGFVFTPISVPLERYLWIDGK
jgi:oligopeptide transport system substrate-binding protein